MSRTLSSSEIRALLSAAGGTRHADRDTVSVALLCDTAARRGELINARLLFVQGVWVADIGTAARRRLVRLGQTCDSPLGDCGGLVADSNVAIPGLTDRTVQETLRRVGRSAGLPWTVTCRDTRRAAIAAALASGMPPGVVACLADHHPRGIRRASLEEALAYQLSEAWISPLDFLLSQPDALRHAA